MNKNAKKWVEALKSSHKCNIGGLDKVQKQHYTSIIEPNSRNHVLYMYPHLNHVPVVSLDSNICILI